ncbi:glycoside hydrolase family 44 protein [Candidatus Magnetomonas plexicatena]|uniref:glycoside hydrolase family 44 protein n=1 Tax=Candidatus Magnetomonas plexicatena TaxID=2552947 RepID=UPI001C7573E3|nr:hypothetical protein E2O03_002635 [Nitrospirales bacterium LBB_01]
MLLVFAMCFMISYCPQSKSYAANQTADSHFGYLGNYYGLVGNEDDDVFWYYALTNLPYFEPFADVGFKYDRPHPGPFVWGLIEHQKGTYDFSIPDAYIRQAQERGILVMPTIWPYAVWDQANNDISMCLGSRWEADLPMSRCKPYDVDSYTHFVKALVERYGTRGANSMPGLTTPIKHWEVLNEPETSFQTTHIGLRPMVFFRGSQDDYYEVLTNTAAAIKEIDPDAQVLNGGATSIAAASFYWEKVFSYGLPNVDIGNYHYDPYFDDGMEAASSSWYNFFTSYGKKTPWLTEYRVFNIQVSETSPCGTPFTADNYCQAQQLVKGYVKIFNNGTDKIFYTYYMMQNQGLVAIDGVKRPAFYALRLLIQKIDYFTSVTTVAPHDNVNYFAYKFTVSDKPVYVIWSSEDNKTVSLSLDNSTVTSVKITNSVPDNDTLQQQYVSVSNSTATFDVSTTPVYVEE